MPFTLPPNDLLLGTPYVLNPLLRLLPSNEVTAAATESGLVLSADQQAQADAVADELAASGTNPLGLPMDDELVIPAGRWQRRRPDGGQETFDYPELRMPQPQLTPSLNKGWIKTKRVNGRTAVENSQSDEWSATVSGWLLNETGVRRPVQQVLDLCRLLACPNELPLEGRLAEVYGMRYAVIENVRFDEQRYVNAVGITFQLFGVDPPEQESLEQERLASNGDQSPLTA